MLSPKGRRQKYCLLICLCLVPQKKSLIATSLIVVVTLFVVVVNYSEKPYFLLQPVFGQTFSSHGMFSKQAFKPHFSYVSIPKQEVSVKCILIIV